MKLNLNDIDVKSKLNLCKLPPKNLHPINFEAQNQSSKQVLRRILFTRQELNCYPNGQIYIGKVQSWFQDKIYPVKKKEKKKKIEVKKVVKKEGENY